MYVLTCTRIWKHGCWYLRALAQASDALHVLLSTTDTPKEDGRKSGKDPRKDFWAVKHFLVEMLLCLYETIDADLWALHIAKLVFFIYPLYLMCRGLILGPLLFFFYQKSFIFYLLEIYFWGPNLQWDKTICWHSLN